MPSAPNSELTTNISTMLHSILCVIKSCPIDKWPGYTVFTGFNPSTVHTAWEGKLVSFYVFFHYFGSRFFDFLNIVGFTYRKQKCSGHVNTTFLVFFYIRASATKVGKSQEFSGMDCL